MGSLSFTRVVSCFTFYGFLLFMVLIIVWVSLSALELLLNGVQPQKRIISYLYKNSYEIGNNKVLLRMLRGLKDSRRARHYYVRITDTSEA